MGFLDNVLKVFVGDKSKKDLGDIQPYLEQVKSYEAALEKLSIDELRAKSDVFRNIIKEDQKEIQDEIDALIVAADKEEDIDKKRRYL
jgi:preprotein translocase subunit SecA